MTSSGCNGWRAEDAIREIFKFERREKLDPNRTGCLTWNRDNLKRCGWKDPKFNDQTKLKERRELAEGFIASKSLQKPSDFKAAVDRFIVLSCCGNAPNFNHVHQMENKAQEWFNKHEGDVPRTMNASPMVTRSQTQQAREYSASQATVIAMRPFTRGQDDEELLQNSIGKSLEVGDDQEGHVYITTSLNLPGYIKIGFTRMTPKERFKWARESCDLNIKLEYATEKIPYPERLETMVHDELVAYRYRFANPCMFCHERPGIRHQEWFYTNLTYAISVVKYWKDWISEGLYDGAKLGVAAIHRDTVRRSASPEMIRARRTGLSPEPASPRVGPIQCGLLISSQSHGAAIRNISKAYVETNIETPPAKMDRFVEAPLTSPPSLEVYDKQTNNLEPLLKLTQTFRTLSSKFASSRRESSVSETITSSQAESITQHAKISACRNGSASTVVKSTASTQSTSVDNATTTAHVGEKRERTEGSTTASHDLSLDIKENFDLRQLAEDLPQTFELDQRDSAATPMVEVFVKEIHLTERSKKEVQISTLSATY